MSWRAEAAGVAPAVLLNPVLYWHGYHCWFQQDDFAWLGLLQMLGSWSDLPSLLFEPMAQGTIRPVSERLFFLLFRWLFDLDGRPYHALVFVTQTANLALLYALVRQLGGGRTQAGLTAFLWCSSAVLAWPLAWVSAYNQILLAACLLGAANAFVRFAATGGRRCLALTWGIYLGGFGVLEANVVFPGLALLYALLWARPVLRHAAWMAAPATVFSVAHSLLAAKPREGVYRMSYDAASAMHTFFRYCYRSVWPAETRQFMAIADEHLIWPAVAAAALVGWILFWRRDRFAAFGAGWFVISVSLYLLIPDHVCDYYLTIPAIGFAFALSAALVSIPRPAAALLLIAFLPYQWSGTWEYTRRARNVSIEWEDVMAGLEQVKQRHPGKAILLEGIGPVTLARGWLDDPFRLIGLRDVKLTPGDAKLLAEQGGRVEELTMPAAVLLRALDLGEAVVFRFEAGECLREVSNALLKTLEESGAASAAPNRIAVGERAYEFLLGSGWFEAERGYRWMGKRAELEIGAAGQAQPGEQRKRLHIRGFCAPAQLSQGPLRLKVEAGDAAKMATDFVIDSCGGQFDLSAALPAGLAEGARIPVTLAVDRTQTFAPDSRAIGLAVTTVEIR